METKGQPPQQQQERGYCRNNCDEASVATTATTAWVSWLSRRHYLLVPSTNIELCFPMDHHSKPAEYGTHKPPLGRQKAER